MSQELIEKFKRKLSEMSYYNAAESDWGKETELREACRVELRNLAKNLMYQGINPAQYAAGYLVSATDYMG